MGSPHLLNGLLDFIEGLVDRRESFGGVGIVSSHRRHRFFRRVHLLLEFGHLFLQFSPLLLFLSSFSPSFGGGKLT